MKLSPEEKQHIIDAFAKMDSKEDLLQLINETNQFIYGEKARPIALKFLTWYSNPNLGGRRYKEFTIQKKSGGVRSIHAPKRALKTIQRVLSVILQSLYQPHPAAMGFVIGKSIVDNAQVHARSKYVYNVDLKDFFLSVDQARVWGCLQLPPFGLTDPQGSAIHIAQSTLQTGVRKFVTEFDENIFYKYDEGNLVLIADKRGNFRRYKKRLTADIQQPEFKAKFTEADRSKYNDYHEKVKDILSKDAAKYVLTSENLVELTRMFSSRKKIAGMIAAICCTEVEVERKNPEGEWVKVKKNVLPQGAPSSPVITNIVCQRLDHFLSGVARRFGLKYSRYADDITFSSNHNVYDPAEKFIPELHRIIADQGFHIQESKTRLQKDGYRKEVTGLIVNEAPNVPKRYVKELRQWLYYWESYGYARATHYFLSQYTANKTEVKGMARIENVLRGKLDYLKMVKGEENTTFLKLLTRFEKLDREQNNVKRISSVKAMPKKVTSDSKSFPILHAPQKLVALLKQFSSNNSALKYTTHSWDSGRDAAMFEDLTQFLQQAREEYNAFSTELRSLDEQLNGKIFGFICNPNIAQTGWGPLQESKRVRFGWSSPELLEACQLNDTLAPEDYVLPTKYQTQKGGETVQKFKQVIDIFKNEIEIRDENFALLNLLLNKHDHHLMGFANPTLTNLENKTFYTNVLRLEKALDIVFENIKSRPQHPKVSYAVIDSDTDFYCLHITHHNSFNTGKSIKDEKLDLTKGNFGDLANAFKNLCDWSVESRFAEGNYRINYLISNDEVPAYEQLENCDGFTYILKFYK